MGRAENHNKNILSWKADGWTVINLTGLKLELAEENMENQQLNLPHTILKGFRNWQPPALFELEKGGEA